MLGPILTFIALYLAIHASYLMFADFVNLPDGQAIPGWLYWRGHLALGFTAYALMPLLAIGYCIAARNRLMDMRWPLTGAVLLTVLAAGFTYDIILGGPGEPRAVFFVGWGFDLESRNSCPVMSGSRAMPCGKYFPPWPPSPSFTSSTSPRSYRTRETMS